ncbi:hypothetical protein E6O75_ATG08027 [Venturia nashicola]|uniref:GPI anchored protein n=1 Tax=Venturia nashicola TaxID=86259 RepID=A0A4Z1NX89_9PEZI|nr:hypothetical protein E6O75_ATG08027 [Venturia nashicola]
MRRLRLLSLPPALLLLIATTLPCTASSEPDWPHNLPAHAKYFPQDEPLVRRGLSAQEQLAASRTPIGVRKMGEDESEMFFLDYWQFEEQEEHMQSPSRRDKKLWTRSIPANHSLEGELLPPLLLHSSGLDQSSFGLSPRSLFARDFQCPSGTNNCSSINHPNSCCAAGETCVSVADNGIGNVGCCPAGATCTREVASCDTNAGYKSCPGSSNGGCCIPNFDCEGVGCISIAGTSTMTTTLPTVTVTSCVTNWHTCAVSLGGGCCRNGAECGASDCTISTTSSSSPASTTASPTTTGTTGLVAPVRPTGSSDTNVASTIPSTLTTGTSLIAVCPSSFYFCSAYYRPGCCRIGRDCATTDCPAAATSSTLVSNGVTIFVPVGTSTGGSSYVTTALITGVASAGTSYRSGSCPSGLNNCDANVGGGCCLNGYGCGTAICTATAAGNTGTVAKVAPNGAPGARIEFTGWLCMSVGAVMGIVMLVL